MNTSGEGTAEQKISRPERWRPLQRGAVDGSLAESGFRKAPEK